MKPLNISAILLVACALGPVSTVHGINLAEEARLKTWLAENRAFVDAQFAYINLPIDAGYDAEVMAYVERYLRPGRRETEHMLGRAVYYLPIFERTLAAHGLPDALKYLPIVESGLFPRIESPAGAVGLWQFMPVTARHFDLEIGKWMDERYDPYRASEAAAQLLGYLYKQFEDWNLALVAYNCGPGCVKKAIRRAGSRSYAAIRPFLPEQTQRYITKYKAAAYVAVFHSFFGVQPRPAPLLRTDAVRITVQRSMSLTEAAHLAEAPLAVVRALNPVYIQGIIPKRRGGCSLVLPPSAADRLLRRLDEENEPEPVAEAAPADVIPESSTPLVPLPDLSDRTATSQPGTLGSRPWPSPRNPRREHQTEDIVALYQRQNGRATHQAAN